MLFKFYLVFNQKDFDNAVFSARIGKRQRKVNFETFPPFLVNMTRVYQLVTFNFSSASIKL